MGATEKSKYLLTWVKDIVICVIVAFLVINYVGQNTMVDGDSMYPSLNDRDFVITNKFIYRFTEPKFQDMVVFPYKHKDSSPFIKRIIGIPGDIIDIREGYVYRNGTKLEETYTEEATQITGDVAFPVEVPDGKYFVLGDNRKVSYDSRFSLVGLISKDQIIGRVKLRLWPINHIGSID